MESIESNYFIEIEEGSLSLHIKAKKTLNFGL